MPLLILLRLNISVTIIILDIIDCLVFHLEHELSETELCLRLQVEYTQLGPLHRATLCLRNNSIYWAQLIRFHLKTDTESRLVIVILMYCSHKSIDVIYNFLP
jgi:hypothetical protein